MLQNLWANDQNFMANDQNILVNRHFYYTNENFSTCKSITYTFRVLQHFALTFFSIYLNCSRKKACLLIVYKRCPGQGLNCYCPIQTHTNTRNETKKTAVKKITVTSLCAINASHGKLFSQKSELES